jgi:hypothetical protein
MDPQKEYDEARAILRTEGLSSAEVVKQMVRGYNALNRKREPLTEEEQSWWDWCDTKLSNWGDAGRY